jgi:hypothetical protein
MSTQLVPQEYILLILNCKKYEHKATYQKNTWLKTISSKLIYYHVIGDNALTDEYKFDNIANTLYVRTEDDYNSLPKKVCAAYHAISNTFDFKYIFKTDDDQMLTNLRFFDMVMEMLKRTNNDYGGHIVSVPISYLSKYYLVHPELPRDLIVKSTKYCSGRFYLLSRRATTDLLTKRDQIEREYLEDYAIGFNLDESFKTNILRLNTSIFFVDF